METLAVLNPQEPSVGGARNTACRTTGGGLAYLRTVLHTDFIDLLSQQGPTRRPSLLEAHAENQEDDGARGSSDSDSRRVRVKGGGP